MKLCALNREIMRVYRLHGIRGILAGVKNVLTGRHVLFDAATTESVANDEFDTLYGVSTGDSVRLSELDIKDDNWIYGQKYEPVIMHDFLEIFENLKIVHDEFTFVDMGSGKGRAVLLAAMLPFEKVVGVELSDELITISLNNLKLFRKDLVRCKQIEIVCKDASLYDIPSDSTVVFFNNPFRLNIFKKVIDNISRNKGTLIIIYYNIINDDGCVSYLESIGSFTKSIVSGKYVIFSNSPGEDATI